VSSSLWRGLGETVANRELIRIGCAVLAVIALSFETARPPKQGEERERRNV
jgi:hypothetical protein